jgi:hypothetical protein
MSALDVGKKLVAYCQEGKHLDAIEELYADDVVSVEGDDSEQMPATMEGKDAIRGKNQWFFENMEVHSMEALGPFVGLAPDQFVVKFDIDMTNKGSGERSQLCEVGLYTVANGRVAREQFLYLDA